MSLVTWGGKLLLSPNGKLTLGPAADECCCVEEPPEVPTDCPTYETIPSFWVQFTLPAGCTGAGTHIFELAWNVDRQNWSFNDQTYWGMDCGLDIEFLCQKLGLDVVWAFELEHANHKGSITWTNPPLPYTFTGTFTMDISNSTDCCGSDDFDLDVTITDYDPSA